MTSNRFDDSNAAARAGVPRRTALRRLGAGGLAAGLMFGDAARETEAQSTLVSVATEAAARRAINAINQALAIGDLTVLDLAFASDYVNHTPRRSLATGQPFSGDLAGLEASLVELRSAVPNAVILVDDVVAAGDTAAVRTTFRGAIDPAMVALPEGVASRLRIGGVAFGRIVDGRVVESWDYAEAADIMTAAPTPTPTPSPEPTASAATPGEAREVGGIDAVVLEGVGTLLITQGETESLTIEAEERVLRRIETVMENGTLIIRPARSFNAREPIIYHLAVQDLSSIKLSGAGAIEVGALATDQLRLALNGAGSLGIEQLAADALEVTASENAAIQLGGMVDQQTVTLEGTAQYAAEALESRIASVTIDGAAQGTVQVSESLSARVGGAGQLGYIGNPTVQEELSAAGSIANVG